MAVTFDKHVGSTSASMSLTMVITVAAGGVAAGNLIVVRTSNKDSGAITGITDSVGGNTWAETQPGTTGAAGIDVWASKLTNTLGAGATITITFGIKVSGNAEADAWAGVDSATPTDTASATGTSTAPSSGAVTANSGDLVVGSTSTNQSTEPTNDSDTTNGTWAQNTFANGGGAPGIDGAYKITTGTGDQTYDETTGNVAWSCQAVVFAQAAGGVALDGKGALAADGRGNLLLGADLRGTGATVLAGTGNALLGADLRGNGPVVLAGTADALLGADLRGQGAVAFAASADISVTSGVAVELDGHGDLALAASADLTVECPPYNASVEWGSSSPDGWTLSSGSGDWSTVDAHTGTHSFRFSGGQAGVWQSDVVLVDADASFTLSCWSKGTHALERLTVTWYSDLAGSTPISSDILVLPDSADWTQSILVVTAPSTAVTARLTFSAIVTSVDFFGDDFALCPAAAVVTLDGRGDLALDTRGELSLAADLSARGDLALAASATLTVECPPFNPSVENGAATPDFWTAFGVGGTWSTAEAHTGTHSLRLALTAGLGYWQSDHFGVTANQEYTASLWMKGTAPAGLFFFSVVWYSDAGGTVEVGRGDFPLDGTYADWTELSEIVAAPASAVTADFFFLGGGVTGDLYADDFALCPVTTITLTGHGDIASAGTATLTVDCPPFNPSAENGAASPDFWNIVGGGGTATWSTAEAHTGTHSLQVSGGLVGWRSDAFTVTGGQAYTLSAWVKGTGSADSYLTVYWNAGSPTNHFVNLTGSYADWTQITLLVTAPAAATSAEVELQTSTGDLFGDDFSLCPAVAVVALDGHGDLTLAAAAEVLLAADLSAHGDVALDTRADLLLAANLQAHADVAFAANAEPVLAADLKATGALAFGATAELLLQASLAGHADVAFATRAEALLGADLSAHGDIAFAIRGDLLNLADLRGHADIAFDASGDLSRLGAVDLTGMGALVLATGTAELDVVVAPTAQGRLLRVGKRKGVTWKHGIQRVHLGAGDEPL